MTLARRHGGPDNGGTQRRIDPSETRHEDVTDTEQTAARATVEHVLGAPSYEGGRFSGLSCRGLDLCEVEFFKCRFDGCLFFQGVFRRCRFEQCVFEKCDLSVMKVPESRFIDVEFQKCKMLGIDWSQAAMPASLAFEGCNVSQSTFQRLALPKMKLVGCIVREVDFSGREPDQRQLYAHRPSRQPVLRYEPERARTSPMQRTTQSTRPQIGCRKAAFTLPEALSLLSTFGIVLK